MRLGGVKQLTLQHTDLKGRVKILTWGTWPRTWAQTPSPTVTLSLEFQLRPDMETEQCTSDSGEERVNKEFCLKETLENIYKDEFSLILVENCEFSNTIFIFFQRWQKQEFEMLKCGWIQIIWKIEGSVCSLKISQALKSEHVYIFSDRITYVGYYLGIR